MAVNQQRQAVVGTPFSLIDKSPPKAAAINVVVAAAAVVVVVVAVIRAITTIEMVVITTVMAVTVDPGIITTVVEITNLTNHTILTWVGNRAIPLERIGVLRYQPMPILNGKWSSDHQTVSETLIFLLRRELFGVNPTGINFDLYNDIPVESSHMDHPPVDEVCRFPTRLAQESLCLSFFFPSSLMTVNSARLSKTISVYQTTANRRPSNVMRCRPFFFDAI